MNKQRRATLAKITAQLGGLMADIESARDEEQEAFDNMPESIQQGERGEQAAAAVDLLDQAMSSLEEAVSALEEAAG